MLVHAVDYGPDGPVDYACWCMLWITGLTALWITMLRICGLCERGSLWITYAGACCGFPSLSCSGAYIRTLGRAGEGVSSVRHAAKQLWRWWDDKRGAEKRQSHCGVIKNKASGGTLALFLR